MSEPGSALVALAAGLAVALALPPARVLRPPGRTAEQPAASLAAERPGWLHRYRLLWSLLAGLGGLTFLGGTPGLVAAVACAVGAWVAVGRVEPSVLRRHRERVAGDLPHVVGLLAAALRSGSAPAEAVRAVCAALPGPAADELTPVAARLAIGADPAQVWAGLAAGSGLAPLGRAMSRAQSTGTPVVRAVERLADELASAGRAATEDRARAVGVRAAVPLGLCLLPAFLVLGIVPLVAGMVGALGL